MFSLFKKDKTFSSLSPEATYRKIFAASSGGQGPVKILDVRTPNEIAERTLAYDYHIDCHADDFSEQLAKLPMDETYIVYCHSGQRSAHVVQIMKKLGFKEAHNLSGGIAAWVERGLPIKKRG